MKKYWCDYCGEPLRNNLRRFDATVLNYKATNKNSVFFKHIHNKCIYSIVRIIKKSSMSKG